MWVIDVSRGEVVGAVAFTGSVNELFAVEVIHDSLSPEVMVGDSHNESLKRTFVLPKTLA